jgi:acetylornithine deacetylase/succinyl-diaminopimelate desuccinylase-like protein
MDPLDPLDGRLTEEYGRAVEDLRRLVRVPSVAAQQQGIPDAVRVTGDLFRGAGGRVTVLEHGGGNPAVVAEFEGRSPRTLLFYNHYDVQPAEPLAEWTVPPFDVTERAGLLYGRGVADNKGNIAGRIAALRALAAAHGGLPCRVKFLVEGEEEISSPHLGALTRSHTDLLRADACIWESGSRDRQERLRLSCGAKGICYLQLEAVTAKIDLHSQYGAVLEGAPLRLGRALATLKDDSGRVLVPGHYDRVRPATPAEEAALEALPLDLVENLHEQAGVARFMGGVAGRAAIRQWLLTPTCTVCGIWGGYTGAGSKTVLPRAASAKVDFRLVPDQDPHEVARSVRRHLDAHGYTDVATTVLGAEFPWRSDLGHPFVGLVRRAAADATGREVLVLPTSAGTGPMHDVGPVLNLPIVGVGDGYWDSRVHAPDENIRAADFQETIRIVARIVERFAEAA